MGELKNRAYFTTTLPKEQIEEIDRIAAYTRIPKSRLTEEAFTLLIKKYEKKRKKE